MNRSFKRKSSNRKRIKPTHDDSDSAAEDQISSAPPTRSITARSHAEHRGENRPSDGTGPRHPEDRPLDGGTGEELPNEYDRFIFNLTKNNENLEYRVGEATRCIAQYKSCKKDWEKKEQELLAQNKEVEAKLKAATERITRYNLSAEA